MRSLLDKIWNIYEQSFPDDERRGYDQLTALFDSGQPLRIEILHDGEMSVGFIIYWEFDRFVYVEHFAVAPIARSQGIGSRALSDFARRFDKPIVLEVEKATDSITRRRIHFYQRHGFVLHDEEYIQPPYSPDKQALHLNLMSKGFYDFSDRFVEVKNTLYRRVYGISDTAND